MNSFLDKCVLYGAGLNAYGVIKYIGAQRVVAIVDANEDKKGKEIEGKEIIDLEQYVKKYLGIPIIITAYQKTRDIEAILNECGIINYFEAPYLQSFVTSVQEIVDSIIRECGGRKIIFDNTINVLVPLIIDELIIRGFGKQIAGCLHSSNWNLLNYYNLKTKPVDGEEYLVESECESISKEIICKQSINICNLMYFNPKYKNKILEKFNNIYRGKRCFLIGNGPSLLISDLNKLGMNNEICFGSNGLYLIFEKTKWRPDYYVITDFMRFRDFNEAETKFPTDRLFIRKFYNMMGMEYDINVNVYNSPPQRDRFEFSGDITMAVNSGLTVTFNMMQIAAYMGFSEIYLIGVDFSFDTLSITGTNHFDTRYEEKSTYKDIFYRDENLKAYEAAEKYSREHGFRIYNATRGGKLEVFERVDFDSLF